MKKIFLVLSIVLLAIGCANNNATSPEGGDNGISQNYPDKPDTSSAESKAWIDRVKGKEIKSTNDGMVKVHGTFRDNGDLLYNEFYDGSGSRPGLQLGNLTFLKADGEEGIYYSTTYLKDVAILTYFKFGFDSQNQEMRYNPSDEYNRKLDAFYNQSGGDMSKYPHMRVSDIATTNTVHTNHILQ